MANLTGWPDAIPSIIEELRGKGLMIGLKLGVPNSEMMARLREQGLLVATAGENVLRLLPPLIIGRAEVEEGVSILNRVLSEWKAGS